MLPGLQNLRHLKMCGSQRRIKNFLVLLFEDDVLNLIDGFIFQADLVAKDCCWSKLR